MPDLHANFAYSTLTNAPGSGGTSLIVQTGDGAKFPTPPFNATVWPTGVQPTKANAEIVRVTGIASDTLTVTRNTGTETESGTNRTMVAGDQIAAAITAKTFTDIEANYMNSWSPAIAVSAGTGLQSLAGNSSMSGVNSIFVFPMTVPFPVKFNQIIMAQSLSFMTHTSATNSARNTYWSHFGLYSMTSNSMALISSNSFAISETMQSVSLSWSFPTSTATSGYGYGTSFSGQGNLTALAQISSYVSGVRAVGLQFGGQMSISAGMYWLGILTYRSTSSSSNSMGLSHAGLLGQIINPLNMAGSLSGPMPIGMAAAEFVQSNARISGWNGRLIMGFATNTGQAGYGGTKLPDVLELANLQVSNTSATVLPLVSFVST